MKPNTELDFFDIHPDKEKEITDVLYESPHTRIERIVSCGQSSPDGFWYDQDEDEWLVVLSGRAVVAFEEQDTLLETGDTLLIPAHTRHRVKETSDQPPCVWLCVFSKKA